MGIKAPLTPFTDTNHTLTTTAITGGTQYELKATLNDALKQVVIMDVTVQIVGSNVTVSSKITLNAAGFPVKNLATYVGQVAGVRQGTDSQGRSVIKSQATGIIYHVTPKTIPGITNSTPTTAAMNALFKAKGLM